ncbi:hypothetical protein R3P38DRAFT_2800422 [Favolaschia claudopus]|uniref:Uncharacterized protein n=1 Tax=Favolaschia claudopus TaxID=2862362 RepID=A0AAV9ZY95_9AGAR
MLKALQGDQAVLGVRMNEFFMGLDDIEDAFSADDYPCVRGGRGEVKQLHLFYQITVPNRKADDLQSFVWVARDVPPVVLALLDKYDDATKHIKAKAYLVVSARLSYGNLVEKSAGATYSGFYAETPTPNPNLHWVYD